MNIYKNLLFLHGYLSDPRFADDVPASTAAREPAAPEPNDGRTVSARQQRPALTTDRALGGCH
jgi:hypothetical protein